MLSTTQIWIAALMTLACYSYLYKENVFFRFAEHTMIPLAVAQGVVTRYHQTFLPYRTTYIAKQGWWWMWIFFAAGILFYTRLLPAKYSWLARYPISIQVGWTLGSYFSIQPRPYVVQMQDAIRALYNPTAKGAYLMRFENLLFFLCFATAMMYFFFTIGGKSKFVGAAGQLGRWILMIGFGASFGNTVQGRISLFLGRLSFLMTQWLKINT